MHHRPDWLRHAGPSSWMLLGLAAVVLLAVGIGLRDPWPADEPRFALIAKEMLATGDFWLPRRGGELYPDKPPLYVWLTALSILLTGSVRLGFLLPSLLAGLGTLWLVADLARRIHGPRIGWLAGAALLCTVQFVMQAKAAQIDMVLTFFTTLGAYGLLRHALLGPAPGWWLLGWGAVGAGIITKGVGFLPLLLLPAWAWLAAKGNAPRLAWREIGRGVLVMIGVAGIWGLPMIAMTVLGSDAQLAAYRDDILFRQTGQRYAAAWHHLNPWYYYVAAVIPWAWLPLVLALPWAAPAWWRRLRRRDARVVLPLTCAVLIVAFFSVSPGKRGVYILPAVPLLVLALAPLLPGLLARPGLQRLGALVLAALGGALLAAGILGWQGLPALARLAQRYQVAPWHWWILLGIVACLLLAWLRPRRGMAALAIWLAALWAAWSTFGYLQLDPVRSTRGLMERVAAITGPGAWLAMPGFDEEFLLQARQPMVHFGRATPFHGQFARAFHWLQAAPEQRWMLIEQAWRDALVCADLTQAVDLGRHSRDLWWLIPGPAFAGCAGDEKGAPLYVAPTTLQPR